MRNKSLIYLVVLFQILVLAGMFAKAFYPIAVGTPIKLKALPIDPRDLFRGNYVRLGYDFSRLDLDSVQHDLDSVALSSLTYGDELFLELALDKNKEFYETVAVWQNPNKKLKTQNIILKAIADERAYSKYNNRLRIKAGIESFFAKKEIALDLESKMHRRRWSFNKENPQYIVWSEVYVTEEGGVRMSGMGYRKD